MTTAPNPIRRGFHRVALFGLVPACVVTAGALVLALYFFVQATPTHTTVVQTGGVTSVVPGIVDYDEVQRQYGRGGFVYPQYPRQDALNNALAAAGVGVLSIVLGGLWWAFWAGVGWVAAGFQRDTKP
jgi:hypothetical protein